MVRVFQINSLANTVVGGTLDGIIVIDEALESFGQFFAGGIENGGVVESRVTSGWMTAMAVPGIETNVVMVAAGGEESRRAEVVDELEA